MPDRANVCATMRHTATPPQMACGLPAGAHSATYPGVTSHSLTRSPALIALRQMLIRRGPCAHGRAHARTPPTRSHTALLGEAHKPHHNLHDMLCPLSRPLAPSLPLSPFVVTPRGTRPTFPNWASRSSDDQPDRCARAWHAMRSRGQGRRRPPAHRLSCRASCPDCRCARRTPKAPSSQA